MSSLNLWICILNHASCNLIESLALGPREHIALVGAGGKTTLLLALARELAAAGEKVVAGTTTKVWLSEASQFETVRLIDPDPFWRENLSRDLEKGRAVFLGQRSLESGKVEGVDPALLDGVFVEENADYVVVEADGSAGHPVKAPLTHEPVIPCSATMVLAVIGLEALGSPLTPDVVFRADVFEKITRTGRGEAITSRCLYRLIGHPEGSFKGSPESSRKVVFLNKTDVAPDREEIEELTRLILTGGDLQVERVLVGSLMKKSWEVYTKAA
ncbi:MAG: putative selenium-dependent hydroxylase accessory protein YqeC [Deltaproteobacteria bacterium HGW-Deltaproteobacteria-21]|nr:MAG: putative selenium-dependent hydroxylase accessory protein YqeC [Deltaproteobacteria bacterium HGW-Deltaproteobacteria-21]